MPQNVDFYYKGLKEPKQTYSSSFLRLKLKTSARTNIWHILAKTNQMQM